MARKARAKTHTHTHTMSFTQMLQTSKSIRDPAYPPLPHQTVCIWCVSSSFGTYFEIQTWSMHSWTQTPDATPYSCPTSGTTTVCLALFLQLERVSEACTASFVLVSLPKSSCDSPTHNTRIHVWFFLSNVRLQIDTRVCVCVHTHSRMPVSSSG